jgi:predicted MFS family arabinose efflux permease
MLPPQPEEANPSSLQITVLMLRRPEFLTYLAAAIGTLTGLWLLETTLQWTVLASSGSSALVGLLYGLVVWVVFPTAAFATGSLADRWGARFVLQAMALLTVGALALLLISYRPLAKLDIGRSGLAQLRTPT